MRTHLISRVFVSTRTLSIVLLSALVWSVWITPPAPAQTMLSDFAGVVTDPSGAAVPNATVTITNEGTRSKRTATTDQTGTYRIDGVLVGTYTVEVEMAGFKKFVQSGVPVTPALVKRVDVALELGEATQTVEVREEVPVIQTESATLSTSLPKEIQSEKPIVNMSRGALISEQLIWAPGSAPGSAYQFVGNRPDMMQTNVEGLQFNFISASVVPSGIQEVGTVLSNAPAEYARPVTVNATLRSGTNKLHGEYWRNFVNPCLNAVNSPFSQPKRAPCATSWRQFLDVSGPVYVPGVYDGRNKTFFFYSWGRPNSFNTTFPALPASVPTLAMQGGDFSKYPKIITDPVTGQPFPGNIISPGRISQFAKGVINDFYGSTINYVGGPDNFVNNADRTAARYRKDTDWMIKLDHNLGTKDIITGFYQHNLVLSNDSRIDPNAATPQTLNTALQDNVGNWAVGLSHTHTFTPKVVNQLHVGVTRFVYSHFQVDPTDLAAGTVVKGKDFVQRWGLEGVAAPDLSGMPQINIADWNFTSNDNQSSNFDTRYSVYDNISIVTGRHTLKTGYSGIKLLQDGPEVGPYFGSFDFSGFFTGEPWADFLLGLPDGFTRFQTRPIVARRRWEHGAFIQDEFRLNSKLTLNFGLRWVRYTVPYDKNGLYYNFDPKTLSIVVPDEKARSNVNPAWPSQTFPIKLANEVSFPSKLLRGSNSWQPRFGFAYRLTPRTVLRGGYGIYNGALRFGTLQTGGPFAITESFINEKSPGTATGALYTMPNPFPASSATAAVASATAYSLDYRPPYAQNWNLTLEREIAPNWGLQATYRGVRNTQLLWFQDLNAVHASTEPFSQSRRPYPSLQTLGFYENGGNSWYQALTAQVTHPWVKGLYTTMAYTRSWSGGLPGPIFADDAAPYQGREFNTIPEYSFDRNRDYGRDQGFPTNDFIMNWLAELPVGKGKRFANNFPGILNAVIGNWSFAGAFSWHSGLFFTPVLNGVDIGNIGSSGGRRPDLVSGCDPYAGARDVHGLWFNPKCYAVPAAGQLGNAEVNSLAGPGAWQLNFNPYKEFPLNFIREGTKIQIGANISNILNHPAYDVPVSAIDSPSAGKVVGTTWARGLWNESGFQRKVIVDMRFIF